MKINNKSLRTIRTSLTALAAASLVISISGCEKQAEQKPAQTKENVTDDSLSRNPSRWPALNLAVKQDPEMESAIQTMISSMTLEQKIGQMIQPEIRDVTLDDMRKYGFGSYLNGGGAFPNSNKHSTAQDWIDLAQSMYEASVDDSVDGSTIPTMWGTDAVHGHNNVIGATIFPHNIGLGAAHNPDLIKQIARATAQEVMATGIDWVFAPTVAVVQDDRWGRTYEGYSERPEITRAYSASIVEGLQGKAGEDFLSDDRVISTVKHFVGDGGTVGGDDQGNNISSEQEMIDIHAQGYFSGLEVGAQAVMASFNSWHDKKMHGNHYMLTTVLKERMGFDGLIVGDWNGHGQVKGCDNSSCPQAVNAGMDILMAPTSTWKPLYENTLQQVKDGTIAMSRIDDAVTRILRVKMRAGLFDKPAPAMRPLSGKTELIGSEAHREVARDAVRQSLVLLKNKNKTLPLNPNSKVFVTGDGANNIGKQSGGWTITWQGTNNVNADFPGGHSIYDGIKSATEAAGGSAELGRTAEFQTKPDVAIVVFGEEPYAEGNGDLDNLEYQRGDKKDLAILKKLKEEGIPVVSLFISGRPLWVNPELNQSDAFVAVWLPGSEGHAIADVIFTDAKGDIQYDFTGKLSYSWPKQADQFILNEVDENYDPLLPYGFGLSYGDQNVLSDELDEQASENGDVSLSSRALFATGVKQPWHIAVVSEKQSAEMNSSVIEIDSMRARTMDRNVQEDTLQIDWHSATTSALKITANFPEDLRAFVEAKSTLSFDVLREDPVENPISIGFGKAKVDVSSAISTLSSNEWKTISVDLQCFEKQGADLSTIYTPFEIEASGNLKLRIGEVHLKPFSTAAADFSCND